MLLLRAQVMHTTTHHGSSFSPFSSHTRSACQWERFSRPWSGSGGDETHQQSHVDGECINMVKSDDKVVKLRHNLQRRSPISLPHSMHFLEIRWR